MFRHKTCLIGTSLVLLVGLVVASAAVIAQGPTEQQTEPHEAQFTEEVQVGPGEGDLMGTPQPDLPSASDATAVQTAKPDGLSTEEAPVGPGEGDLMGTPQPDLPSAADAVTAQTAKPDERSIVSRPPAQAQGTPGAPVAGPACLVAAIPREAPLAIPSAPLTCFESLEQARAAVPAGARILGILYEHAPPSGRSLVIYGANCNYQGVSDLRVYNFNDITSSLDNSCPTVTLYFDINYGEPQQSYPNGRTNYVGNGMNDQASSVAFKP